MPRRRWAASVGAPQPVKRWTGMRDASEPGHDCMQIPYDDIVAKPGATPSKDCLALSVWRPSDKSADPLPVMVWVPGAGTSMADPPRRSPTAAASPARVSWSSPSITVWGAWASSRIRRSLGRAKVRSAISATWTRSRRSAGSSTTSPRWAPIRAGSLAMLTSFAPPLAAMHSHSGPAPAKAQCSPPLGRRSTVQR
jgi:hypothetical protein